jgi:HK97 family phage major capsid protein
MRRVVLAIYPINDMKRDARELEQNARDLDRRARREGRELTDSENQQIDGWFSEVDRLNDRIEREERLEGINSRRRISDYAADDEDGDNPNSDDVPGRTVQMDRGDETRDDRGDSSAGQEPEDFFDPYTMLRNGAMGGWESDRSAQRFRDAQLRDMSVRGQREFLRAAQSDDYNDAFYRHLRGRGLTRDDVRSMEHVRTMVEGVDASGGYLAPTQLVGGILREAQVLEELKPRMDVIRASAKSITYTRGLDSIVMGWVAELGTKPEDEVTFEQFTLTAHVAAVVIWISDELLEDETYGLQGYLQERVGEAKTLLEEEAFVSGSGSGRPFGLLTRLNTEAGTPNRFTTDGVGFTSLDIISLPYDMPTQYRRNAVWILGTNAIKAARLERDGAGGAATLGGYMWQPSLQAGEPATLDGKPVIETTSVALNAALTTGNDIGIYGDLRRYRVYERLGLQVKRLEELRALTDEVGFRFRFRTGGDTMLNEAFRSIRVGS